MTPTMKQNICVLLVFVFALMAMTAPDQVSAALWGAYSGGCLGYLFHQLVIVHILKKP